MWEQQAARLCNSAEHELRILSSVQTESLQFSLVSCKNWKTNEYSTYLRIQKYIKVNLIHTLGNFIEHRRRCQWILLTPFIESEVRHFGSSGIRSLS